MSKFVMVERENFESLLRAISCMDSSPENCSECKDRYACMTIFENIETSEGMTNARKYLGIKPLPTSAQFAGEMEEVLNKISSISPSKHMALNMNAFPDDPPEKKIGNNHQWIARALISKIAAEGEVEPVSDGWISVEDELPPKDGSSFIIANFRNCPSWQAVAWYHRTHHAWLYTGGESFFVEQQTHWQPLPAPPINAAGEGEQP